MTVAPNTVLKCVLSWNMENDTIAQNVFKLKLDASGSYSDSAISAAVADYCEAILGEIDGSIFSGNATDDVIVNEWDWNAVDEKWETGRHVGVESIIDNFTGSGDMVPHVAVAVMTGYTDEVRSRGRKSFSGFTESSSTRSALNATQVTEMVAAGVEWISDHLVAGSDYLVPGIAAANGDWLPFIAVLVSDVFGSQVQRKPGRGI